MGTTAKTNSFGIEVGDTLLGKYQVLSVLGQGGMGIVVKARHMGLDEEVAIKCLRPDVMLDPEAVARFVREAQAAVKLKSEHVARVSDVGTFDGGKPYMVMEYLDGQDLEAFAGASGTNRVNPQLAIELIIQAAEALAEAHSLGIVHRDIKPTNLFITWRPDGSPLLKVLDFGISKSPIGTDMSLTQTQSILGTPAYMSPEQMRSARKVDPRTDIWSLATVLYEVLEGHRPFEAESFSEMCVKVAMDPPTPMEKVPPQLAEILYRALAKPPEQRFSNVAELARALAPFSRDAAQSLRSVERMTRMLNRRMVSWDGDSMDGSMRSMGMTSPPEFSVASERTPAPVPSVGLSAPSWAPGPAPMNSTQQGQPFQSPVRPTSRPNEYPVMAVPTAAAVPLPLAVSIANPIEPIADSPQASRAGKKKTWLLPALLLSSGVVGAVVFMLNRGGDSDNVGPQIDKGTPTGAGDVQNALVPPDFDKPTKGIEAATLTPDAASVVPSAPVDAVPIVVPVAAGKEAETVLPVVNAATGKVPVKTSPGKVRVRKPEKMTKDPIIGTPDVPKPKEAKCDPFRVVAGCAK